MDELQALEEKIFGVVRGQKLRPTLLGLFALTGISRDDLTRWCQLKADALLLEFLPKLDWPFWIPQSKAIEWLREQAERQIPIVIDKYFNSVA